MANSLTANPWVVDTAAAGAILTDWANLRSIQWEGATTAGHEAVVQDQSGRVIWRRIAQGTNQNFDTEFEGRFGRQVNGLIVPTLGSGTLYITFAYGE